MPTPLTFLSGRRACLITLLLSPWALLCLLPLLNTYAHGITQVTQVWTTDRVSSLCAILARSLLHAGAAALLASIIAFPAAKMLSRMRTPHRLILLGIICMALLIPVIIHTFAWLMAFGTTGWLSPLLGGSDLLRSPHLAIILIWTSAYAPLSLILQYMALTRRHRAGEELAHIIPLTRVDRIRIQWGYLALPALAGWLVMLILMLFNSTVPAYFGAHFFSSELMSEFSHPAHRDRATALALPVQLICIALMLLLLRLGRHIYAVSAHQARDQPATSLNLPGILTVIILVSAGTLLPLLMMAHESNWLSQLASDAAIASQDIKNSASSAFLTLVLSLPLALSLYAARVLSTRTPAVARTIDLLATLPATLPQSVIALAVILFWSQPDWRHVLYDSHFLHPLGLALIMTPLLYWCLRLSRITSPNRFHEAAELTGMPFFHRFWLIDLRAARQWLILGLGAIAAASLANLEASQLLSRAGGGTLSQMIARNLHYGRDASMASHGLILVGMIAGVALTTLILLRCLNRKTPTL